MGELGIRKGVFDVWAHAVWLEYQNALKKHPEWPESIVHQTAIMAGEAGEALQAALHVEEGRGKKEAFYPETLQTAAMCFRLWNAGGSYEV